MTMETKIYTKISCDNCEGTGKIKIHSTTGEPSTFYDYKYCEFCRGAGFHEDWIGINKFAAMLGRLEAKNGKTL